MIPQHAHCQVCGKAVKYGEAFCSEKCKKEYEEWMRKRRRMQLFLYAMIALIIIVYMLMIFSRSS
ncbi:MAG: DUF2116 family Zn-ribbon domain-containing protein [Thermoplasmata archaeon]|nr:MAG: DUF2116 family Zn-ribbon domain-containing protein [Thermoplasmata archaeon]